MTSQPVVCYDQFLLDPCRGEPVFCRTVGFQSKDHSGLYFHRVFKRYGARDNWTLVQCQTKTVAELQTESAEFVGETEILGRRPEFGNLVCGARRV